MTASNRLFTWHFPKHLISLLPTPGRVAISFPCDQREDGGRAEARDVARPSRVALGTWGRPCTASRPGLPEVTPSVVMELRRQVCLSCPHLLFTSVFRYSSVGPTGGRRGRYSPELQTFNVSGGQRSDFHGRSAQRTRARPDSKASSAGPRRGCRQSLDGQVNARSKPRPVAEPPWQARCPRDPTACLEPVT